MSLRTILMLHHAFTLLTPSDLYQIECSTKSGLQNLPTKKWFSGDLDCVKNATKLMEDYDICKGQISAKSSHLEWDINVHDSEEARKASAEFNKASAAVHNMIFLAARNLYASCGDILKSDLRRKVSMIKEGSLILDDSDKDELDKLAGEIEQTYNFATVTRNGKKYRMEPDLSQILVDSRDPDQLKWAWYAFRNEHAPKMREPYLAVASILEKWSHKFNYSSTTEQWIYSFLPEGEGQAEFLRGIGGRTQKYERSVRKIVDQVHPLFRKVHAYVRHKLHQHYGSKVLNPEGPIPSHLTGSMWGQEWDPIIDLVLPYPGEKMDVDGALQRKYDDVMDIFHEAENFYKSIGFDPMPESFWEKSVFTDPGDGKTDCHGSASTMVYPRDDVRLLMCAKVDRKHFHTAHHEMGHDYYYLAYAGVDNLSYTGATPAFHEAVGDTIGLMSMGLTHLSSKRLLGTDDNRVTREMEINFLMQTALMKIPFIAFSYVVDKWTFDVYHGTVSGDKVNEHWWHLILTHQGLTTPEMEVRGENYFDAGAKYHIANRRYVYTRYLQARVLQFMFLESLCAKGDPGKPLHLCDISGNKSSTDQFREMLSLGASRPWPEALKVGSGKEDLDASVMLKYFEPLENWLDDFIRNENIPVGW